MASKRNSGKEESTSSTSNSTKGEHSGAPSVINTFANDGSFLELFKKRMEKDSQKGQATEKSVGEDDVEHERPRKVDASCEEKQTEKTAPGSTKILTQQGKRTFAVGKMGGASRQIHAKKKKQEKDAAEAAKKAEEEAAGKSSAWKAYMDEVQRYREMSCSDDSDRVQPLVK